MASIIGTNPNQVPTNADLGTLAYQDYDVVAPQLLAGRRNLIINGAMQVAQRGTTVTPPQTNQGYSLDRMGCYQAEGEMDYSQSTESPARFYNSLSITPNTANASPASNDFRVTFRYIIEGSDTVPTAWGTSEGKTCTLSFWMKTNKIGIYPYFVTNNSQTTTFQTFINVTNTDWNYYTQTIPAPPTGNGFDLGSVGRSIDFQFNFGGLGSNYRTISSNDATMNTWTGTSPEWSLSDAVNFDDSTSNQLYITGLQFELGKVATPFEHRSYGEELALCQRYAIVTGNHVIGVMGNTYEGNAMWSCPVPLRTSPSVYAANGSSISNVAVDRFNTSSDLGNLASMSFTQTAANYFTISTTNGSQGLPARIQSLLLDAEL